MNIKGLIGIRNINDLRRSIGRSIIVSFLIIGSLSAAVLFIIQTQYSAKMLAWDQQQIENAITIYQSNLSEKISMVANSTTFVDFLRSGNETRKALLPDLRYELSNVNFSSVAGMEITDHEDHLVFSQGKKTDQQSKLSLCYLNRTLNNMGQCNYYWTLYFTKKDLLKRLKTINPHIDHCDFCSPINFLKSRAFGSFMLEETSPLHLKIRVTESNETLIYLYSMLILAVLISFTIWNRYRVKSIVDRYIASPIEKVTQALSKGNTQIPDNDYIDELNYLTEQINYWKIEVKKAETQKHEAAIGRLASQVVHDIRSPLTALDTAIRYTTELAEEQRILIRNAVLRIHDIANNLLGQYKQKNQVTILPRCPTPELIADIVLRVVSEKRVQINHSAIQLMIDVPDDLYGVFAKINASEFQRALSNLIANAIESIADQGRITLSMMLKKHWLSIRIEDTGCGIPHELLPTILEGKKSVGKQGSGLGLARAKNTIESWGGKFIIKSDKNGTSINLLLQISAPAPWFTSVLKITKTTIIVLDDDASIHVVWNERFKPYLKNGQINLIEFDHPSQLMKWHKDHIDEEALYFIDFEYKHSPDNGLSIIQQLGIEAQSYLVTSHYENKLIQEQCQTLNITMIPKGYAPYIPIELASHITTKEARQI